MGNDVDHRAMCDVFEGKAMVIGVQFVWCKTQRTVTCICGKVFDTNHPHKKVCSEHCKHVRNTAQALKKEMARREKAAAEKARNQEQCK